LGTYEKTDYSITLLDFLTVNSGRFSGDAEVALIAGEALGFKDIISQQFVRLRRISSR